MLDLIALCPSLRNAVVFRSQKSCTWDETFGNMSYQPVAYSGPMIDYQFSYFIGAGWDIIDASMIILNDGRPCALLPLFIKINTPFNVTSNGQPIYQPIFLPTTEASTVKKICSWVFEFLSLLHNNLEITELVSEGGASEPGEIGITEWHRLQLTNGAAVTVYHEAYTKISMPLNQIRASIRKSFRPLISMGQKLWSCKAYDETGITQSIWSEFRDLHVSVAGRVTRSEDSWAQQYKMISQGNAFYVELREKENDKIVGGALFQTTRDEYLYAVGAYDRTLFAKPLGHVVQYAAILRAIDSNAKWHKIGYRPFPQDNPTPSAKEISIGEFKQGFSTHLLPKFRYKIRLETCRG